MRVPLLAAVVVSLSGCPTKTNYANVAPTARLEVFGTKTSTLSIDVTAGPAGVPKPPATAYFDPNDVVIRATGSQLDKGLGKLELLVKGERCSKVNPDGGVDSGVTTGSGEHREEATHAATGPQGILQIKYEGIADFLRQIRCANGSGFEFDGNIVLVVTVTNVAGLKTVTPPVSLQRK